MTTGDVVDSCENSVTKAALLKVERPGGREGEEGARVRFRDLVFSADILS
jgi:hypothetical protein